jgi:hypothetical protein
MSLLTWTCDDQKPNMQDKLIYCKALDKEDMLVFASSVSFYSWLDTVNQKPSQPAANILNA